MEVEEGNADCFNSEIEIEEVEEGSPEVLILLVEEEGKEVLSFVLDKEIEDG